MERGLIDGLMEDNTLDNIMEVRSREEGYTDGQMEVFMMVLGNKE